MNKNENKTKLKQVQDINAIFENLQDMQNWKEVMCHFIGGVGSCIHTESALDADRVIKLLQSAQNRNEIAE